MNDVERFELKEIINPSYESFELNTNVYYPDRDNILFPKPAFVGISKRFFDDISRQSSFIGSIPNQSNEIILTKPPNSQISNLSYYNNIKLGENLKFSVKLSSGFLLNITMKVVGIYSPDMISNNDLTSRYGIIDRFVIENPITVTGSFLTNLDIFDIQINNSIKNLVPLFHSYQIDTELSKIELGNLADYVNKLETFSKYVENTNKYGILNYIAIKYTENPYQDENMFLGKNNIYPFELKEIQTNLDRLSLISILLIIPNLILIFFFIDFSMNLLQSKINWNFQLLKIRGLNEKAIKNYFYVFYLISFSLSIVFSFTISVIISITILKTDFFSFVVSFNSFVPYYMSLLIIIFTFFFHIIRKAIINAYSKSLSKINQQSQPYWKRKNIDIILTFFGIIGNVFFFIFIFNQDLLIFFGINDYFIPFIIVMVLLFLPFPFFLLIGSVLLISRMIPKSITLISKKLWSRYGNLLSYSFINIQRNNNFFTKKIVIFSILISFTISYTIIPVIIEDNLMTQNYYQTGADIFLDTNWNASLEEKLLNDDNIIDSDKVASTQINIASIDGPEDSIDTKILYSNYLNVIKKEYLQKKELVSELINKENTIFISEQFSEIYKYKLNSVIELGKIEFKIIGIYDLWPGIENGRNNIGFIISNNSYSILQGRNVTSTLTQEGYIAKIIPGYNVEVNYRNIVIDNYLSNYLTSDEYLIIGISNIYLLILLLFDFMIIILISILINYNKLNENSKEIAVERSLGLTSKQLRKLLMYENLVIILYSNIIGIVLGIGFSISLISIWLMIISPTGFISPNLFSGFDVFVNAFIIINLIFLLMFLISITIIKKHRISVSLKEI